MLGLTVYTSAFVCEAIRSGINTVPLGQAEAARVARARRSARAADDHAAAGVPRGDRPAGHVLIALTKNTTVASAIGVAEASLLMKEMIENDGRGCCWSAAIFAAGFVILTLPIGLLFGWLGKRLAVAR